MTKFDDEIISGSVLKSVWKIAWPVVITQLIAGIGGTIDQILVGLYVEDYNAQVAVGASWMSFLVILVFLSSFFHGMNILIARYSGKRDIEEINRVFFETLKVSIYALFFVVAPLGYFLAPYLLNWVTPDPEVQQYALPYLRILFTATLPLFIMFIMNGAFQSIGNPKIPLYFGIMTTAVKILTSYLLIAGPGPIPSIGVLGAAIGTCVGPVPSVIIAFVLISRHKVLLGLPHKKSFLLDMTVVVPMARLGIPAGIQAVLLNLGGLVLLYIIGTLKFSAEAQAAYLICYGNLFSVVTWAGFGLRAACATVMGQNMGAGKEARGTHAVYVGTFVGFLWASFFGFFFWFFSGPLLGLFSLDGKEEHLVISYSQDLLHFLTFSGMFVVMSLSFTGGLQGAGDTKKPMYIAFISQIIVLLGVCAIYQALGELTTTKIWSAILFSHLSRLIMSYVAFARGGWRDIKVEIGHQGA